MDRDDERYLNEQIQLYKREVLNTIAKDCLEIFKQAIREAVYDSYTPIWYDRTYQLLDNSVFKIEDDILYIYIDADSITYHSWVNFNDTGREVGSIVPYLVENGHMDNSGVDNQYHSYEPRYYLERAKMKIDLKYGIDVEIINDKPSFI